MEIKYDNLSYHNPTKGHKKNHHIPTLTRLELRLYNSIAKDIKQTGRTYLKRAWLKSKSRKRATLLVGIGRYNLMSDDLQVSFETKVIPLENMHNALKD